MLKMTVKKGEIRIFNNNGVAEAYCYNNDTKSWDKMGEVLGKKDNKKYYNVRIILIKREIRILKQENTISSSMWI